MKNKKLLVCTFSGGRTSAFMGKFLNEYDKYKDFDKVFMFANTGKEKEETKKKEEDKAEEEIKEAKDILVNPYTQ